MSRDLSAIFKAYDIRGVYPTELDEDVARRIGTAFARFVEVPRIVTGRDMRTSSPDLVAAFIEGSTGAGAEVIDVGLVSTDGLYFASGILDVPGAMFTASHNPSRYNGLKLCRRKASPIASDTGLDEIRKLAEEADEPAEGKAAEERDLLDDYAEHCRGFVETSILRPLKVAVDAGNGMAGRTVPIVFEPLPFEIVPLYFDLDGTFPNHPANPIEEANLADLQTAVTSNDCDLGIAFDGDADRMFLVDERADLVSGSLTTALVADRLLEKFPGEAIIYNLICSWTVPEVIEEKGGRPIRTRVGHYYIRDNFRADSGIIAALLVLEALSRTRSSLSDLLRPFRRYHDSGEINSEVSDQVGTLERLAGIYADGKQDRVDGLTVEYSDWWFNCRPSNTEPLLRLNPEARTKELMAAKRDEVLAHIRGGT